MKNKITAIYYRTSKNSKNGIRMQKKFCRGYCKQKKITRFKEYSDVGISGLKNCRPSFNNLKKDLEDGKIKKVIVYKIDRLGRKFNELSRFYDELENKNIALISTTQNFDFSKPEGKFMLRILMLLSEFESGMISRRTIDGLNSKTERRLNNYGRSNI